MPSMPSIRNPFRKAPQVTPTLKITGSTESFASSFSTTTEQFKSQARENYIASSFGRPYSPLSLSTGSGSESPKSSESKAVSIVRGKADEFAGEYKLSGKSIALPILKFISELTLRPDLVVNDSGIYLPVC